MTGGTGAGDDLSAKRQALVELLLTRERPSTATKIKPRSGNDSLPLSFAQERLWFLDQYYPGSPLYNIPAVYPLAGNIDPDAVRRTLNRVIARHEVLRTTLVVEDGRPVQRVAPQLTIEVPLVDLLRTPEADRDAEVKRHLQAHAGHIFDLRIGPLITASLLRVREDFHLLSVVMHHIVSDAWSMDVFAHECNTIYAAVSQGIQPALLELPIQYADFAIWQRERVQTESFLQQLDYWRTALAGATDLPVELPADRPSPPALSFRGETISFRLQPDLSAALRSLSAEAGLTLFMTLLAGFKALLLRYSGRRSVVVGFPTASRNRTELEHLIGFFVNSLVLQTKVAPDASFRELMASVKDVVVGALANQDVPFERLVEELHPARTVNANPLFQVMFDFRPEPSGVGGAAATGNPVGDPPTDTELAPVSTGTSKFALSLSMTSIRGHLCGSLEYSTDLLDPATAARLAGHLRTLLGSAVREPDSRLTSLSMHTVGQQHQLLREWNDTARAFSDVCVHERIEAQVRLSPDALAAVSDRGRLTYAELDTLADRMARTLRQRGVGPEVIVGVCMEGSLELIVSVLAILKAGGAFLPLDPSYPENRLSFMVRDSGAALILTQEAVACRAAGLPAPVLSWEEIDESCAGAPERELPHACTPRNACYVIYTSGSTGTPKGVVIEHRSVVNLIDHLVEVFAIGPGSRILQFSSFSFDISIRELFETLFTGATLHLHSRDDMAPGQPLFDLLAREAITMVTLVPSIWAQLPPGRLPQLTTAVAGGEACTASLVERWAPSRRLFNAYGPTEATVASSVKRCLPSERKPTIGRPLANTQYYVVDRHMQLCAVGQVGELLIGGAGLARGYLNRPGMTADRFIPDPFGDTPGGRLYRTGDLARLLPDGEVDCLGRLDGQVKIHGFRIELGEIEAVLVSHPDVDAAAVTCTSDAGDKRRLTAYVVARPGVSLAVEELRRFLAATLPAYMIPHAFAELAELPLTGSGKVDYRTLPDSGGQLRSREYLAPRDPVEDVLADVWQAVLGVERVGVRDNFFELGGHSLLVTQIVSRLRDVLGVEVPIRAIFEAPTVAELAFYLVQDPQQAETVRASAALVVRVKQLGEAELDQLLAQEHAPLPDDTWSVPRRDPGRPVPLSFAQERLWFLEQFEPGTSRYNIVCPLPLPEPANATALTRSLGDLVARHEILRTVFSALDGQPTQVTLADAPVPLAEVDLFQYAESERGTRANAVLTAAVKSPFDLAKGPLLRAILLRFSPQENVLALIMHHIICDGWSLQILQRELLDLYRAHSSGQRAVLAPLPVQYADYAAWQRDRLAGSVLDRQIAYWREHLASAPAAIALPLDRPRPQGGALHASIELFEWPRELCEQLERLGADNGATPFMVVLAAFQALLFAYTGQSQIVVGSPIANRERPELEPLIGFFSNTVVLCTNLRGQPTFRELLGRVREAALGAFAHQDVPFERIVEELQPERNLGINPIFQVMFAYQDGLGPLSRMADSPLPQASATQDQGTARVELMLYLERAQGHVVGAFEYATELFDRSTVQRMVRHFRSLIERLLAAPDEPLAQASVLDPGQRHQLLREWSGQLSPVTAAVPVTTLVERQARLAPDAAAIVSGEERWSYRDLLERAGNVAAQLSGLPAGDPVCVGVAMPRGPQLLAVLLGTLQAGAAYLPLDPSFPAQRLELMLADAQVPVVIASRAVADRLPEATPRVLWSEQLFQDAPTTAGGPELPEISLNDPAYVIYTSGSTGTPKGIVVTHHTLASLVAHQCHPEHRPAPTTLQFSSPSFDVSLQEIFATWCAGGTIVCAPEDDLHDPAHLRRIIAEHQVQRLFLPFVALRGLVESGHPELLPLKEVITAGEQLKVTPALRSFFSSLPGCSLVNQYGPAETHVVSEHRLDGDPQRWPELPPIGRPVAGAILYVLDEGLRPRPVGVTGELYIGGGGLAQGYLSRPALTAERFLPDPFSGVPGARMYRTGDMARYRADGQLEFLGRTDSQVKIRGYRVEPGELELQLLAHPQVADAVVVSRSTPGGMELAAYAVPVAGGRVTPQELRELLRAQLPPFMLPARLTVVDQLPLTATGKIDKRRLLLDTDSSRPELPQPFVPPRSPLEEQIAEIWQAVLGVEKVGAHDDFFALGGHSLLATQIISRLRTSLGVEVPLRTLFEAPSVAQLAVSVVELQMSSIEDSQVAELLHDIEGLSATEREELAAHHPQKGTDR